ACTISTSEEYIELPDRHAITLFRIFQETLNNILKHSRAKNAQVEVVKGDDHLEMIVFDDGVGFDASARNKPRSFGLRGMQERVEHLGGSVKISSTTGKGTQIAIFIPLEPEQSAGNSSRNNALGVESS
ncbi:MAG: ATP-binding protein, partial [Gallionella sp.]